MIRLNIVFVIAMFLGLNCGAQTISKLRTEKRIVTCDEVSDPYYGIQILALKNAPKEASFFSGLDEVREYDCSDGYKRYVVGQYKTYAEANANLTDLKSKYQGAFVANTKDFKLAGESVKSSSSVSAKSRKPKKLEIVPTKDYVVQVGAFRYPLYTDSFKGLDNVIEYRLNDKIFRYTTQPVKGTEAEAYLEQVKALGYPKAFLVEFEEYQSFMIE